MGDNIVSTSTSVARGGGSSGYRGDRTSAGSSFNRNGQAYDTNGNLLEAQHVQQHGGAPQNIAGHAKNESALGSLVSSFFNAVNTVQNAATDFFKEPSIVGFANLVGAVATQPAIFFASAAYTIVKNAPEIAQAISDAAPAVLNSIGTGLKQMAIDAWNDPVGALWGLGKAIVEPFQMIAQGITDPVKLLGLDKMKHGYLTMRRAHELRQSGNFEEADRLSKEGMVEILHGAVNFAVVATTVVGVFGGVGVIGAFAVRAVARRGALEMIKTGMKALARKEAREFGEELIELGEGRIGRAVGEAFTPDVKSGMADDVLKVYRGNRAKGAEEALQAATTEFKTSFQAKASELTTRLTGEILEDVATTARKHFDELFIAIEQPKGDLAKLIKQVARESGVDANMADDEALKIANRLKDAVYGKKPRSNYDRAIVQELTDEFTVVVEKKVAPELGRFYEGQLKNVTDDVVALIKKNGKDLPDEELEALGVGIQKAGYGIAEKEGVLLANNISTKCRKIIEKEAKEALKRARGRRRRKDRDGDSDEEEPDAARKSTNLIAAGTSLMYGSATGTNSSSNKITDNQDPKGSSKVHASQQRLFDETDRKTNKEAVGNDAWTKWVNSRAESVGSPSNGASTATSANNGNSSTPVVGEGQGQQSNLRSSAVNQQVAVNSSGIREAEVDRSKVGDLNANRAAVAEKQRSMSAAAGKNKTV